MAYISAIYYMIYPEQQSTLAKHLEAVRDKAYANFYNLHTSTTAISNLEVAHRDCWMRALLIPR